MPLSRAEINIEFAGYAQYELAIALASHPLPHDDCQTPLLSRRATKLDIEVDIKDKFQVAQFLTAHIAPMENNIVQHNTRKLGFFLFTILE